MRDGCLQRRVHVEMKTVSSIPGSHKNEDTASRLGRCEDEEKESSTKSKALHD